MKTDFRGRETESLCGSATRPRERREKPDPKAREVKLLQDLHRGIVEQLAVVKRMEAEGVTEERLSEIKGWRIDDIAADLREAIWAREEREERRARRTGGSR